MKKLLALVLAAALMAAVSGCGAPAASSSAATPAQPAPGAAQPAPEQPAEQVVIRFWQAGADTADATNVMNELLTRFMQENPGILVQYQAYPWANDPHTAFQTAIAGGDVADVLVVGSPFDVVLASGGQTRTLDEYLDESVKGDLQDVFARECVYNGANEELKGKYISVPLFGDARTVLYNKAIFDEAGVAYPTESWTMEAFLENAQKLTGTYGGKKVYGFGTTAMNNAQFLPFVWNLGGEILNEDETAPAVNTEAWVKGLTYFKEFFDKGITPAGSEAMPLADVQAMFMNGEVAMMIGTSDYAREMLNNKDFADKLGVGVMPHGERQTAFGGADVMVMTSAAKHPEEAAKLINFLESTESQLTYAKRVGFSPSVKSAAADSYFTGDPVRATFAEAVSYSKFYVKKAYSSGVTKILRAQMQEMLIGNQTVEQCVENMQKELTSLIAEEG